VSTLLRDLVCLFKGFMILFGKYELRRGLLLVWESIVWSIWTSHNDLVFSGKTLVEELWVKKSLVFILVLVFYFRNTLVDLVLIMSKWWNMISSGVGRLCVWGTWLGLFELVFRSCSLVSCICIPCGVGFVHCIFVPSIWWCGMGLQMFFFDLFEFWCLSQSCTFVHSFLFTHTCLKKYNSALCIEVLKSSNEFT